MYRPGSITKWAWVLLLAPWIANAAGLGTLTVRSSLGQPLLAEIELLSVTRDELSTLDIRLAPNERYQAAGMQYGAVLSGVRFSVEKRANGAPYVKVISTRAVNEPYVNLIVELNSSSGRFTREYTALIDPPGYTPPQTVAAPAVQTRPAPRSEPSAVATPPAAAAARQEYGPVKRGETLGKIAAKVKPEGVSLEQMLVSLYRSNREAFINSNMNLLRAGTTLEVPDRAEVSAIPRREAAQEIRVQTQDWNRYRRRLSDRPARVSERDDADKKGAPRVKVEDKSAAQSPKDVLRLSKGQLGAKKGRTIEDRVQALEEELIARERALKEANQRIKELEKSVNEGAK